MMTIAKHCFANFIIPMKRGAKSKRKNVALSCNVKQKSSNDNVIKLIMLEFKSDDISADILF